MRLVLAVLIATLLSGCGTVGYIRTKLASVTGVKDAGKPAVVTTSEKTGVLTLPKDSNVVWTKVGPIEGIPATPSSPARPYQPAKEVMEVKLAAPAELRTTDTSVNANTGTVDTSIAEHRIDIAASQPLLYAAIAAGIAAVACLYFKYPTPAAMCAGASLIFLIAWKSSQLPPWFWMLGIVGLAAAAALWVGHERGLKTGSTSPAPEPPSAK